MHVFISTEGGSKVKLWRGLPVNQCEYIIESTLLKWISPHHDGEARTQLRILGNPRFRKKLRKKKPLDAVPSLVEQTVCVFKPALSFISFVSAILSA